MPTRTSALLVTGQGLSAPFFEFQLLTAQLCYRNLVPPQIIMLEFS